MDNYSQYHLHLFDLDDTLITTRHAYYTAQKKAIKQIADQIINFNFEREISNLQFFCQQFGSHATKQYFNAFLSNLYLKKPQNTLLKDLLKIYQQTFFENLQLCNGVALFLKKISLLPKVKLMIVSNGKVDLQIQKIKYLGLDHFFSKENIFLSEQFHHEAKKPNPYMIKLACRFARIKPANTIFYGNTITDIIAGNLAKVTTVLISNEQELFKNAAPLCTPTIKLINFSTIIL